jgi:hypothetical protein
MAEKQKPKQSFRFEVPLDASQIEDFKPEQEVKVVVQRQDGSLVSQTTRLNEKGQGAANFAFDEHPGALRVFVGPATAADDELLGMQTISLNVPAHYWQDKAELILPPIMISAYYWYWWPLWCRTFTIRGRVLCPDGSPVPGAQVCAYDVDMWWWWCSTQQVGCATTDAFGAFEIKFRWCCGWWPWWWWRYRVWRLEPLLADRILPALKGLNLKQLPLPSPRPDLALFESMLTENGILTQRPGAAVDPAALDRLRGRLMERLPVVPELEPLRLWPWWPWWPWWDCTPDIIFRVTQNCRGQENVIVDESCLDTRWDIPTALNVTLVANDQACCIEDPPPPPGKCMVISQVCGTLVDQIGGNPGAPAAPAGYANPGWVAAFGDRPYAGVVSIAGLFGSTAAVDYYEFEWAGNPAGPWNPMPLPAAGSFSRSYWGPQLGGGPVGFHNVPFSVTTISGQNVFESREHFEANNDPLSWGLTRFWVSNRDLLMQWLTQNNFADGTYYLRVNGWSRPGYVGNLDNPRILPLCDTDQDNRLVLTVDNQVMVPPAAHPHPCGPGTVHNCTMEPDTNFESVLINGVPAEACATVDATKGGTLDINFIAYDPDGHLAYYTLEAHYGNNLVIDLLSAPGAILSSAPPVGPVPSAAQVGPNYGVALTPPQTAASPTWAGGSLRLTIPNLRSAFPETCCYQLKLRAYKRTIVNCYGGSAHNNTSEYSLTVIV